MYITYDKEVDYNYITTDNNAKISSFSSQCKGCAASNIICNDKKSIWLTDRITPQYAVIDLGNLIKKPKSCFRYFGVYCWHAYSTNPKRVELHFSKDNKHFVNFGAYDIQLKPGNQFFEITNHKLLENKQYRYLKFVIKEAYGGNRTYVNQIYLFDELSGMSNTSTINTNKVSTQYSDNKRNAPKSESESLIELDNSGNNSIAEEEEESVRQIEVERSKLNSKYSDDVKDYSRDRINFIEKNLEKKRKVFDEKMKNNCRKNVPESRIDYIENNRKGGYTEECTQKEEPTRHTKNRKKETNEEKLSDNQSVKYVNDEDSYYGSSLGEITQPKQKVFNKKVSPEKNKFLFDGKNSNSDFKNKTISIKEHRNSNEYNILENQLKDMENHLSSMQADIQLQSYKSDNYYHSKSYSFLNPLQENKLNPFLDLNNFKSLNKTDKINSYDFNNKPSISNQILNQYIEDDYMTIEKNKSTKNINIEKKIENIENKISNFEGEIRDLKQNFEALMNNINRLIESGGASQNTASNNVSQQYIHPGNLPYSNNQSSSHFNSNTYTPINNQFNRTGDQMNQNEMMSVILNECQKMVNEKYNLNQTQSSNNMMRKNINESRNGKSSLGKIELRRSDEYYDEDEDMSMEKSKKIVLINLEIARKIEEKFETLASNIESQIYKKFLKPSLNTIDKTLKSHLDDIKNKIKTLSYDDCGSYISESQGHSLESLSHLENELVNTKSFKIKDGIKEKNLDNKLEEINSLGGRLYEKLLEKEKKLNKLKNETTLYLKKRLNTTNSDV